MDSHHNRKLAVVGLGYVGLPLAVAFGETRKTLGFDVDKSRISELSDSYDRTLECTSEEISNAKQLTFSASESDLAQADVFIIAVPTPVTTAKVPDLSIMEKASKTVGAVLKKGDIVIYESTVYPGATEDMMVPILERESGLKYNVDFFVGYSPERINPGDKERSLKKIVKVTSGSTAETADLVDALYGSIIEAGTHKAQSIKVAEAAKVIENVQRDVNIALINELSTIFGKLNISTRDILKAAQTKWNFLPFEPGLVGGHCIGVDPYYLTHKAQMIDFHPEIILAGRRTNDKVSRRIAEEVLIELSKNGVASTSSRVLVMGFTFKENCPDLRNTKVFDVVTQLKEFGCDVSIWDPVADPAEAHEEYGLEIRKDSPDGEFDAIVITVKHEEFIKLGDAKIDSYLKENGFVYDVKWAFPERQDYLSL